MSENYTPRLKTRYREEIRKTLNDEFKYDNVMQIPGAVSYTHLTLPTIYSV